MYVDIIIMGNETDYQGLIMNSDTMTKSIRGSAKPFGSPNPDYIAMFKLFFNFVYWFF